MSKGWGERTLEKAPSCSLPGLAEGSSRGAGRGPLTQEITVEKQQAVHFSSLAVPLSLVGETQTRRSTLLRPLFGNRVRPLE